MSVPKAKASSRTRRAWPVWRSRPLPRRVVISAEPPTAQITFYPDVCMLARYDDAGVWRAYPVDPAALAQALSSLPYTSGLLPANTLATGMVGGAPYFVVGVPARITPVQMSEGGKHQRYLVPLPPLIWAGYRSDYRVFAIADTTYSTKTPLFNAPLPNVYRSGSICWGTTTGRGAASAQTMRPMLKLFLEDSAFSDHLADGKSKRHPTSILPALRSLADTATYPVDDLVLAGCTLGQFIAGTAWSEGHQ